MTFIIYYPGNGKKKSNIYGGGGEPFEKEKSIFSLAAVSQSASELR